MSINYQKTIVIEPSSRFRAIARDSMFGRGKTAMLVGFIYLVALNLPANLVADLSNLFGEDGYYTNYILGNITQAQFAENTTPIFIVVTIYTLLVSGALSLGMAIIFLGFVRRKQIENDMVFSGFSNFGRVVILSIIMYIFVFLWSLLFIIPGIIAMYRYKFAYFILADNPEMSPMQAIRLSKHLTYGNKGSLFILDLSYIGWFILATIASSLVVGLFSIPFSVSSSDVQSLGSTVVQSIITSVITAVAYGYLNVYMGTAEAAFYERAGGIVRPNVGQSL